LLLPPQVKAEIAKYKVGAPARVGLVAPNDVTIPAGGTGMDPSQTSFFQALAIATKINKGEAAECDHLMLHYLLLL
jgi:large subunit ribosomal protein LP0